jgi:uncharacterized coiled-coil DUF342 family protein
MSVYVTVRDIDDIRDVVQALINEAIEKHDSDLADDYEARLDEAHETIVDLERAISERDEIIEELNQQIRDLHVELQGLDE